MKSKNDIKDRQRYTPCELKIREKEGEGESRTIEGYAILFNTPSDKLWEDEHSEAREVIAREAITRELLDGSDIKFTMFHDRQLILARSKNGKGTLTYNVDEKGVSFSFDAPNTQDGDKALELVRRGDISGCSFAFRTRYFDSECVERTAKTENGHSFITYRVKAVTSIHDFTLAADPAYPDTTVSARELEPEGSEEAAVNSEQLERMREQVEQMRRAARFEI